MNKRPRRNRKSRAIRALVRETELSEDHLVYPLFIKDGNGNKNEISSLPGNFRWNADQLLGEIESCVKLGLANFILFPVVEDRLKDEIASYGLQADNFYLTAARKIKEEFPEVHLISDVALDPYSSDGHDGLVKDGQILNDETLPLLGRMAVVQAEAGFDTIGPSDMMDGRVGFIRNVLDDAGHERISILSYSAKYASAFYNPFRDALDSAPKSGDKKTYQMDPANQREALIEAYLDEEEGADMIMVKPALHYLDVISLLKSNMTLPIAAYHVSGECAMLYAACAKGWLDYEKSMVETLLSIRRAGADIIITYLAKDYARIHRKA